MVDFSEEKTKRKLDLLRKKEEEEATALVAKKYGLPYADLSLFPVELDALRVISEENARLALLAVFQIAGKHLKVGVRNPEKDETRAALQTLKKNGYAPELYAVSSSGLNHVWDYYRRMPKFHGAGAGAIQISQEKIQALSEEIQGLDEIKKKVEGTFSARTITEALEVILAGAIAIDASDVHLEPQTEKVRLRLRLDGVLHDLADLPKALYALLLSRIKLISELKLNIHDKAQDGRFTIHTRLGDVEVRTSVLPGPEGENVVLRVLNPKIINISFENLGLHPLAISTLERELKKPNGMILTTGPTGSGKTTALYAFLKKIHTPEIKIITLEDPIEYHLSGIEQTQADAERGYDFANGLRAIVRQDPDVILVGEIRDFETAETAINAALTGHLVFSTLHTNNAAGAIPRLINLGVKPASIAPALNIAMAQRLIRKLCAACKIKQTLSEEKNKEVLRELAQFPKRIQAPPEKEWTVFRAAESGCRSCNNTGYKGRTGVYELISVNEAVERLILQDPAESEIQKEAAGQGEMSMRQDGILKILSGITDFGELDRVVGS